MVMLLPALVRSNRLPLPLPTRLGEFPPLPPVLRPKEAEEGLTEDLLAGLSRPAAVVEVIREMRARKVTRGERNEVGMAPDMGPGGGRGEVLS